MKRLIALLASTIFACAFDADAQQTRDLMTSPPPPSLIKSAKKIAKDVGTPEIATVLEPNRSPLITFRILFMTGAASDPTGQEGVAGLTARMLAQGGSRAMAYEKILEAMYPIATTFEANCDKEMTAFFGTTHADNLATYYGLISQMLLDPGFREEDFQRLKKDAINFLKVTLRESNDEELGKEQLYNTIYAGHPYGHHNVGSVKSLEKLTLQNVRDFYKKNYTRGNVVIGLAGAYPADTIEKLKADFAKLPAESPKSVKISAPPLKPGMKIDILQRQTRSTAISLGFPISVTRADKDWPALALATSYFGQHRSSNSFLYQRLREARGLNYGDYAYIEYFPAGMFKFEPDPNRARQQQIFQIWIRPVPPENGHFTLRATLFEYDKLVRDGLSQEAFDSTRDFLTKFSNILTATQDAHLGYAMDSRYYKVGDYGTHMREQLAKLTRDQVNDAIRRHLKSDKIRIVMVTDKADDLKKAIVSNAPSPIKYNSEKPPELLAEDKVIETYKINVRGEDVRITPATQVFE